MMINNTTINQIVPSSVPSWISKLFLFSKAAQAQYVNANALTTPKASTSLDAVTDKLSTQLLNDPKKLEKITKINQKRATQGLAPLDTQAMLSSLKNIVNNINLSGADFKKAIEDLRKQSGLSKGDMRELITKDLGAIYQDSQKQFSETINTQLNDANAQLQQYANVYGTNSPQYLQLQNQIGNLQNRATVINQNLNERGNSLKGMYKKRGGFFSKLKGAFKKITGGILNVAKNTVGKALGVVTKAFPIASKLFSFIPGVGQVAGIAGMALGALKR